MKVNITLNNEKEEKDEEEVTYLKDYIKVNGECIPKKGIFLWNLKEYYKTYSDSIFYYV